MDRQTLRDWVHRYNGTGLEGLKNRPDQGAPPRKLAAEREQRVAEWVRQGPDLERHQVVRWRLVDLRDEIAAKFGAPLHECSVGRLRRRLQFSHWDCPALVDTLKLLPEVFRYAQDSPPLCAGVPAPDD